MSPAKKEKKAIPANGKKKSAPRKRVAIIRTLRAATARREHSRAHQLERHENNPIIEPREHNFWEMKATFNPGAIYADNRVHLLYRAIGGDDVSVLGYASSKDGATITDRSEEPAFTPPVLIKRIEASERLEAPVNAYSSGGGWNGGCEDPRITLIDNVVYLIYTAFDGWGSIRIALSSINLDDFLHKRWKWNKTALISPPGEIHKNWTLFPEKINGKFAILHGITPEIMIEYRDSLDFIDEHIPSARPPNDLVKMQVGSWDSWVRGAGPPPIKTKLGWLLFYHATDKRDPGRYKIGAMVLASDDPTKILYRSRQPILEPDAHYENHGFKSGVIYSCGAVVKDGELYVYYGGGDSVVCVAMANLDKFLEDLKQLGTPKLAPEKKAKSRNGNR